MNRRTPWWWFNSVTVISHPVTGRAQDMLKRAGERRMNPSFVYAQSPAPGFSMSNMRRNPAGEFGCSLSHLKALCLAMHRQWRRPLFLEDDVEFGDDSHLREALDSLPPDWSVVYLGGHPCEDVERVSDHLVRVGRFSFAEAYCVNGNALPDLVNYWIDRAGQHDAMFDRILGEFARDNGGYCVVPTVTSQPPGHSHVAGRYDDKKHCMESAWAAHLQD